MSNLTDRDRAILEFERGWWQYEGVKTTAIREAFGLTPVRYYQLVNSIIDRPAALEVDPLTVKRLRRLRDLRRAQRRRSVSG